MVPRIKHQRLPLLPYERDFLELVNISEDEYRFFVAEAMKMAKLRPADYEHIPEVYAGPVVPILINLAIGLALSAAAYLLMPKPKTPGTSEQGRSRQLASRDGLTAFAPTTGFDTQAQVATYGDPIPIIFGRYTGSTGGILFSPKLVWSRAFSYGTQQGVKLMFVVSEQGVGTVGIDRPDLEGIFLGTQPLDAAFDHTFAFYWRSGTFNGTSRIKINNRRYGTRGTLDSGDPENNNDVFLAPTRDSQAEEAFCTAYSPNANTTFGVYAPVYNGTDYRVNWKIVPIPRIDGAEDDPKNQLTLERVKIAGSYGLSLGPDGWAKAIRERYQEGTGRGYSRRMGIVSIDGVATTSTTEVRQVSVGSTCVFQINGTRLRKNLYYVGNSKNVQVDDINSDLDTQAAAADTALQLGETIQIGFTLWKVIGRSLPIWQKGLTQNITLQCIELLGSGGVRRQVGLVATSTLTGEVLADNATAVPISYYPLMRSQFATVRNTRPCDVTEIGIKSQVWNRANGLCNFASLPSTDELRKAQEDRIALQSGTMTLYFKRTSSFAIQVRPAGTDSNGNPYAWVLMGRSFCITGDQPIDLYNYIRIQHPEQRQYEFRFIPRPGADTIRHMGQGETLWQLDARHAASATATFSDDASTAYGTFRIFATGRLVDVTQVEFNEEMATASEEIPTTGTVTGPAVINVTSYQPTNLGFPVARLRQGFLCEVLGAYSGNIGQTYSANVTYNLSGSRTITIKWSAQLVSNQNADGSYINGDFFGFPRLWFQPTTSLVSFTGTGWTALETFDDLRTVSGTNPYNNSLPGIRKAGETSGVLFGPTLRIDQLGQTTVINTVTAERIFERNSQLADVSFYGTLLSKSNESSPEHSVTYVNEIIDNPSVPNYDNLVTAGLALKASRTYSSLDQIRVWKDDGIPVVRFHPDEAGTVGASNLFCDLVYYLLTDKVAGAGNTIAPAQIKTTDLAATARFLRTNKLFFDGAIVDPVNIREFVTRLAPSFLCNFVIADGLFSVVPALPTTASGGISTGAVPISALFTGGNILEDTFSVEYINSEERDSIQAVMRYRQGIKNQLPEEKTLTVRWNETGSQDHKVESFDLTQFCTSRDHALLAGKFILSVRRRITHTVKFKTTPYGLDLAPGKFIRVVTQANPYSGANNGVIGESGAITSITPLADGNYSIIYYRPPATAVASATLTVSGGATSQTELRNAVFTVSNATTQNNVYMIEQLTLDEEGMVEIVASEFPTDAGYSSRIAQDVTSGTAFLTEG